MNLESFDRVFAGYVAPAYPKKVRRRGFLGAVANRLTNDWNVTDTPIDADIYTAMPLIRARARDLSQNNEYGKRYLNLVRNNVAGPNGFKFEPNVLEGKVPDYVANLKIAEAWESWCRAENCTVTGRLSFRQVQHLLTRTLARDGEFFVRKIRSKDRPFGFALQLIEPDLVPIRLNAVLSKDRVVVMGVELDEWRRPVAYYVGREREGIMGMISASVQNYDRIPAEDIIHVFDPERAFQTRGVTWYAASLIRLRMLSAFEEAMLVKARAAAQTGGWMESTDGAEYDSEEKDADGNDILAIEPGEWKRLPTGVKAIAVDPKFPDGAAEGFSKSQIRAFASGFNVSYASLANDLTDVNYSSIRAGLVDEREMWKTTQEDFREYFLLPVFEEWLTLGLLRGDIGLPFAKYDKFNKPVFTGRRWAWVDPLNDVNAEKIAVQEGFKTRSMVCAERGESFDEILAELAREEELAKSLGVELGEKKNGTEGKDTASIPGTPADAGRAEGLPNILARPQNGRHREEDGLPRVLVGESR